MRRLLSIFVALLALPVAAAPARAITITGLDEVAAGDRGSVLANHLVGAGVTISNVAYRGGPAASGLFSGGAVFGIEEGIVLTNGSIGLIDEVNDIDDLADLAAVSGYEQPFAGDNGLGGDADLSALIDRPTADASVLEFDFVTGPGGDTIRFDFVFASEEYNEFTNADFNDAFAFFLTVDGGQPQNVALIPGTSLPISINTVNGGIEGGPTSTAQNLAYYRDNDPFGRPEAQPPYAFELDGFTIPITIVVSGLDPDPLAPHHMKFVIADAFASPEAPDRFLDSAVFLAAESFSSNAVPEPATLALVAAGLALAALDRRRRR